MVGPNLNDRFPTAGFTSVPPVNRLEERLRRYFDQHPELGRDKFLLAAVRREIDFREQRETENKTGSLPNRRWTLRTPLSAEDIRFHARLNERLAMLSYERYGFLPRLRRFLFSNRLVRRLSGTADEVGR